MRLSSKKIKEICDRKRISLTEVLHRSKISRTSYYSLSRKNSVVPRSLVTLAKYLNVPISDLLFDDAAELRSHRNLLRVVDKIVATETIHERDNVRHTLLSLRKMPIERLQGALIRYQGKHRNVRNRAA